MSTTNEVEVLVPITIDGNGDNSIQEIIDGIIDQTVNYGLKRVLLCTPLPRWRGKGYPKSQDWKDAAQKFLQIKNAVTPYGTECGWWVGITVKSGRDERFSPMIRADGSETPFSSCPLDPAFRKQFAEDVANFIKTTTPTVAFFEDDFSISASTFSEGCFCERHLNEFAKRQGRYYSREELNEIFKRDDEQAYNLRRAFRELSKDTLLEFSEEVRKLVDKENPTVPIGICQTGASAMDGDFTFPVISTLSGKYQRPKVRLAGGCFYCGGKAEELPVVFYGPLWMIEKMGDGVDYYLESDTYPHTCFFNPVSQIRSMFGVGLSYGMMGAIYQTRGFLDDAGEETGYSEMFKSETKRFEELKSQFKKCEVKGIQLEYDPFWNKLTMVDKYPEWLYSVSRFGIPYTTKDSPVRFWDKTQAKRKTDEQIKDALSKGLFLDGDAARILCERGYGEYLGVSVGDDINKGNKLSFDLSVREVICEEFAEKGKGRRMHSASLFAPVGNGKMLNLTITDENAQVVAENWSGFEEYISPSMTIFENKLGGKVVVSGLTLEGNFSHALFNYRRQRLLQSLIVKCGGDFAFSKDAPNVWVIQNDAKSTSDDFYGVLTVINLTADTQKQIKLRLPEKWKNAKITSLSIDGVWEDVDYTATQDGVVINSELNYYYPVYLRFNK